MSEHNQDKSMEDVLFPMHCHCPEELEMMVTYEDAKKAMSEWGEICTSKMAEEMVKQQKEHNKKCAEKDKEIEDVKDELESWKKAASQAQDLWVKKESIIKELLSALEASNNLIEEYVKNSYGVERVEANYQIIQKLKQ